MAPTITSLTDEDDHRSACALAATDEAAFSRFRASSSAKRIFEITCDTQTMALSGQVYLDAARDLDPGFLANLDEFRRNDSVGSPQVVNMGAYGALSFPTARYIKIAVDIGIIHGSLDGLRIAEIGGAYGGQARILHAFGHRPAAYRLYDLPEMLALARRYLSGFQFPNLETCLLEQDDDAPIDLLISNYAISEVLRPTQELYLAKVIARARRGFVLYNAYHRSQDIMSAEEFASHIPGAWIETGRPFVVEIDSQMGNVLILW